MPEWQESAAIETLEAWMEEAPSVFMVLGSGLGALAARIRGPIDLPFVAVPGLPRPTVRGHAGRFVSGRLEGTPVLIQVGRLHTYEGHSPEMIGRPTRLAAALGATACILTNAVGSLRAALRPGSVACVRDVLDMQRWGAVPADDPRAELRASRSNAGPADRGDACDPDLRERAKAAAQRLGMSLPEVVYAGVRGPSYETAAEVRVLAELGADVVGMSTVQEVAAARQVRLPVLVLSVVTNHSTGLRAARLTHDEVIEGANLGAATLEYLVRTILEGYRPSP